MFRLSGHIFLFFVSVADISFWSDTSLAEIIIGDLPLDQNPNAKLGLPISLDGSSVIISRTQYIISWNMDRRVPTWVSWSVSQENLGESTRTNVFHIDRDLDVVLKEQNRKSVSPAEYRNTCLDRGHQVPSADRTASEPDNESTFLMSNVTPQSAYLNRRTWVSLERFVRRRVILNGEKAQIYTGAIYPENSEAIGPSRDIHVPSYNFKIVALSKEAGHFLGGQSTRYFVVNFANVTSKGTSPVKDQNQACTDSAHTPRLRDDDTQPLWRSYLSSLAQIESASGLSFSFLQAAHQLSAAEVDGLLVEDGNSIGFRNPFMVQTFGELPPQIYPWQPQL